jgi:uncharacterized protein (UPF0332 family)
MGDQTVKRVKRGLLDLVIGDIYWSVITPSQALLMLYGLPPPTPKEVVPDMKKIFLTKEKMLEKKYIDILEEIVIKYYKGYEHEKVKEVSGKEVDHLLKNAEDYMKRLKELRAQIEKRAQERTIDQIYNDTFELLKVLVGKKSQEKTIEAFEKDFVKVGKFSSQHLRILKDVVSAKKEFKKGKSNPHKVDHARKNAGILINDLIEYSQRKDLVTLEKGRMRIKYQKDKKEQVAEILSVNGITFLFEGNVVKKLTDKVSESNMEEVTVEVEKQKAKQSVKINPVVFELLKKELGKFEIVL